MYCSNQHAHPPLCLLPQIPSIQQTACLALGRLANYNDDMARAIVQNDILPHLVGSLLDNNVRGWLGGKQWLIPVPQCAQLHSLPARCC